ncbi:MAG: ABC transporter ATP-binding protein [Candidatus Thermoplasmatota archaeon]|nr:ABC transporter ATP-binding protein [Candidatus Thermoplasmatota archaeon]
MSAIEVKDVCKSFGEFKALDGVSFRIEKGELFGLLGPNGAGKTTLLRILTGQLEQDGGEATVLGIRSTDHVKVKENCGIVPESESPPSFLTALEFLQLVCMLRKTKDIERKTRRWLSFFRMDGQGDILCRDMSKGQRQKLMLASAFIHEPRVLLLDEPFINLDPIYQRKVRDHLESIRKEGITILMCTHILDLAEKLCGRVAIINNGRVIATGTLEQIRKGGGEGLEDVFIRLVEGD